MQINLFFLLLLFLCFEFGDYFILLPRDLFINGGNSHLFDLYRFLYLYIAPYYIPFSMLGVLSCLCWFCVAAAHRVWHPTLTSWHLFSPFEVEKNFEVLKMEVHLYGSPFFCFGHIYLHFPIFNDTWREYFQRTIHNESILSFLHGNH